MGFVQVFFAKEISRVGTRNLEGIFFGEDYTSFGTVPSHLMMESTDLFFYVEPNSARYRPT